MDELVAQCYSANLLACYCDPVRKFCEVPCELRVTVYVLQDNSWLCAKPHCLHYIVNRCAVMAVSIFSVWLGEGGADMRLYQLVVKHSGGMVEEFQLENL